MGDFIAISLHSKKKGKWSDKETGQQSRRLRYPAIQLYGPKAQPHLRAKQRHAAVSELAFDLVVAKDWTTRFRGADGMETLEATTILK